jgi:peptide deformylase
MKILIYPHPMLFKKLSHITSFDNKLKTLSEKMIKIMEKHHGIGLSANQVGIDKRILVYKDNNEYFVLINPVITNYSGETEMFEGCLSIPWTTVLLKRPNRIIYDYYDLKGILHTNNVATGFVSRIIQHEVDHLNGITM